MGEGKLATVSYDDLYARWERGSWCATAIDFSADRPDWERLGELRRRSMRWQLAMFFNGEDAVTETLSPYIDAAPREEQKYFLATQQADEARHTVFFARFFDQVLDSGGSVADGLASCAPDLNWGYRKTFERLDRMANELRRDRSLPRLAQAITLYHLVIEAQLAQPGQHLMQDYTERLDILPGFREGIAHVSRDEERHVAFGVKLLSELLSAAEECKAAVAELLREVLRYTMVVFAPPGGDRRYADELGFTLEEVYASAMRSFETKMRLAGLPIEELPPGVYPFDLREGPDQRAARVVAMFEAGLSADPDGRPDRSERAQRMLFDAIERSADVSALDGREVNIQWRFSDAPPWRLRIGDGEARAEPGDAPTADVTIRSRWADWVRFVIADGGVAPALLRGRLRIGGAPRQLLRLRRVFPR